MKKLLLGFILIGACVVLSTSNAQAQYQKGDKLLNLGIGINSYYGGGIPIGAALEVGITDEISVGGAASYLSHSYGSSIYSWKYSSLYVGGRGSYHVNKLLNLNEEKIDLYGGLGLGYRTYTVKDRDPNYNYGYNNGALTLGGFVGGRYYFSEKMAVYAELGAGGYSNANIGITFKF